MNESLQSDRIKQKKQSKAYEAELQAVLDFLEQHPEKNASEDKKFLTFFDTDQLEERLSWAKSLSGESKQVFVDQLLKAQKLGPKRKVAIAPEFSELKKLAALFPNFSEAINIVEQRVHLSMLTSGNSFRLPPLLLSGPPGTGKSEFSRRLANLLKVPAVFIDIASLEASFKITGLDAGYTSGTPGLIWSALQNECMSPVIVLDEIEKQPTSTKDSGTGIFLNMLEPSTAAHWQDSAMRLPVNASRIFWIATCNRSDLIDPALRSRFVELEIQIPDENQLMAVIRSIHGDLLEQEAWGKFVDPILDEGCMACLKHLAPRQVKRALEDGYAQAASQGRRRIQKEDLKVQKQIHRSNRIGFI
jgi:ATP-dependent Lon protease